MLKYLALFLVLLIAQSPATAQYLTAQMPRPKVGEIPRSKVPSTAQPFRDRDEREATFLLIRLRNQERINLLNYNARVLEYLRALRADNERYQLLLIFLLSQRQVPVPTPYATPIAYAAPDTEIIIDQGGGETLPAPPPPLPVDPGYGIPLQPRCCPGVCPCPPYIQQMNPNVNPNPDIDFNPQQRQPLPRQPLPRQPLPRQPLPQQPLPQQSYAPEPQGYGPIGQAAPQGYQNYSRICR